jgi:hypothetical protein
MARKSPKKIYRVSRSSLLGADPPPHLRDDAPLFFNIPQAGLRASQVKDMILPHEDRLWILLFACGLEERKCLAFARICALRCMMLWMIPYPEIVVQYLRTGRKVLAREAREFVLSFSDDAMKAAAWAATVPLIDSEKLDVILRRWTRVSPAYRAYAAAASARKAGISGEDQIVDLLSVMDMHPTVLALRMSSGHFETTPAASPGRHGVGEDAQDLAEQFPVEGEGKAQRKGPVSTNCRMGTSGST